jgi:hypothetical protein
VDGIRAVRQSACNHVQTNTTMKTTIHKDNYSHITHDTATNLIRIDWLPDTAQMSLEEFKHSLTILADATVAHSPRASLQICETFISSPQMRSRPPCNGKRRLPESKGVPAFGVQMQFRRHASVSSIAFQESVRVAESIVARP